MKKNIFAHKTNIFYDRKSIINDYILGINETELDEETKKEAEAYYFAICLLVPKESFIKVLDYYGGLDIVSISTIKKEKIAKHFKVPVDIINLRLCELKLKEDKKLHDEVVEKSYQRKLQK